MNCDAASTIWQQGKDFPLAGCLGQGQSPAFMYDTVNSIMGPERTPKKIESKQPDIKLNPNIDTSKLGVESKQVVSWIITYFTEMFEKKDREIKELLANVSMFEMRVVKLEQQIDENSAHERKNTLIMVGTIPHASQAEDCKFIVHEQIREHLRLELLLKTFQCPIELVSNPKSKERISVTSCLNFATEM